MATRNLRKNALPAVRKVARALTAHHISPVRADWVEVALRNGAKRSREASSALKPSALLVVVWRRFRWALVGIGLFVLLEVIGLGGLLSHMGHF